MKRLLIMFSCYVLAPDELKKVSWSGIPKQYRQTAWKILSVSMSFITTRCNLFKEAAFTGSDFYTFTGLFASNVRPQEVDVTTKAAGVL